MNSSKIVLKIVNFCFSILLLLLVVFGIYRLGQSAYSFGYRVFTEEAMSTEDNATDKVVQITSDMSAADIGALLEKKELIRDKNLFVVQLKLSSYSDKLKPGTYTLSTNMTAREMMQVMSADVVEDTEEQG